MLIEKVLLATDFSASARNLEHCVKEFQGLGLREVVLTHVVDVQDSAMASTVLQRHNKEALEEEKERLLQLGVEVKVRVELGYPPQKIVDIARRENVSLILVGSHGKGFLRELLLGSTAFDIIRSSEIPVYVEKYQAGEGHNVEPFSPHRLQNILVPIDFSYCSEEALEKVLALGRNVGQVNLVAVIESSEDQEELEKNRKEYQYSLEEMSRRFHDLDIPVYSRVEVGVASEKIMEVAGATGASMIVLSTRGTGRLQRLFLGSTADAVARRSQQPTLLIPCRKPHGS